MLDKIKMKETSNLKIFLSIILIHKLATTNRTDRLGDFVSHEDFSSSQRLLNPLTAA